VVRYAEFYSADAIILFLYRFLKKENKMPMGLNSTHFISYHDINVDSADLIEDAWGLNAQYCDVIDLLLYVSAVPERELTEKLIDKIRKNHLL
jgi:hypothetical protein